MVTKFNGFRVCAAAVELHSTLLYGRCKEFRDAQSPLKLQGGAVGSVEDLHVRSCYAMYNLFHKRIMSAAENDGIHMLLQRWGEQSLQEFSDLLTVEYSSLNIICKARTWNRVDIGLL